MEFSSRKLHIFQATIFVHLTKPCIVHGNYVHEDLPMRGYPPTILEFFLEEFRVFINLLASGTVKRYPDVKIIIPRAGGALSPILDRFSRSGTGLPGGKVEMTSKDVKEILSRQVCFDLSGFVLPDQLYGLLRMVDPSRLLYRSDFPYTAPKFALQLAEEMDEGFVEAVGSVENQKAVYQLNAQRHLGNSQHF